MKPWHATMCIAMGTVAIMSGGALAAPAVQASLTATTLGNIGAGLVANTTHDGVRDAYDRFSKLIRKPRSENGLPTNHDLLRAVRLSQINAVDFIIKTYAEHAPVDLKDRDEFRNWMPDVLRKKAATWYKAEVEKAEKDDFGHIVDELAEFEKQVRRLGEEGERVSNDKGLLELERIVARAGPEDPDVNLNTLWELAADATLEELNAAGIELHSDVLLYFDGAVRTNRFAIVAQQYFAEFLKTDPRLRTVYINMRFDGIEERIDTRHAELSVKQREEFFTLLDRLSKLDQSVEGIEIKLADRFDALEAELKTISATAEPVDIEGRLQGLFEAMSVDLKADIREILREELKNALPHDEWKGSKAIQSTSQRIAELLYHPIETDPNITIVKSSFLMPNFFGRENVLDELDDWLIKKDRGLCVVTAQSGGGKSAILAAWNRLRQSLGDKVVRHFISIKYPSTTTVVDTLTHLLVQLRYLDRGVRDESEAIIPSTEKELNDAIHKRLSSDCEEGQRLVVIIDALDELAKGFEDTFLQGDLGKGVYVVVSHRAEGDHQPLSLRKWLRAPTGAQTDIWHFKVPPMTVQDIKPWLEEYNATLNEEQVDQLVIKLERVTEGVPLFLKETIKTLLPQLSELQNDQDRMELILSLSEPFSGFLRDFINDNIGKTVDGGSGMSTDDRKFLALMTQMLGPVSEKDLQDCLDSNQFANIDVRQLHERRRLVRWFTQRTDGDEETAALTFMMFDHPRLSVEFAKALGTDETNAALRALIIWCAEAWPAKQDEILGKTLLGAVYPLRYLPSHRFNLNQSEQAAALLTDSQFIQARFLGLEGVEAANRMGEDWRAWLAARYRRSDDV